MKADSDRFPFRNNDETASLAPVTPPNPHRPVKKTRSYREYDTVYDAAMDEAEQLKEQRASLFTDAAP